MRFVPAVLRLFAFTACLALLLAAGPVKNPVLMLL
jgi:hypothetical protein